MLDLAAALGQESPTAAREVARLYREEQKRLLYVAVTRAQHFLCVLTAQSADESILPEVLCHDGILAARPVDDLPSLPSRWHRPGDRTHTTTTTIAPLPPGGVHQTYARTSFSGITARRQRRVATEFAATGGGSDEESDLSPAAAEADVTAATGPASPAEFAVPDLPAGTAFGSVVHEIFERIDLGRPLAEEVRAVVAETATSQLFAGRQAVLADTITRAMQTPFGGPLGDRCFADFARADRLAEMDFEMALADSTAAVRASDVGRVFAALLPPSDPLHGYAAELSDPSFDIPLAGLINGSIDAVLRIRDTGAGRPRLVIADYKTNKLHRADAARPAEAYAHAGLVAAMAEHHYPLQAAVYGTAVYRMLRWRLGEADPADCIAGVVYAFIRGTRGADGPVDAAGRRHGMFVWQPPPALWPRLSRLFAGDRP